MYTSVLGGLEGVHISAGGLKGVYIGGGGGGGAGGQH